MESKAQASVHQARRLLRQGYPTSFFKCLPQVTAYGQCISSKELTDIKQNDCVQQFNQLKKCFSQQLTQFKAIK